MLRDHDSLWLSQLPEYPDRGLAQRYYSSVTGCNPKPNVPLRNNYYLLFPSTHRIQECTTYTSGYKHPLKNVKDSARTPQPRPRRIPLSSKNTDILGPDPLHCASRREGT